MDNKTETRFTNEELRKYRVIKKWYKYSNGQGRHDKLYFNFYVQRKYKLIGWLYLGGEGMDRWESIVIFVLAISSLASIILSFFYIHYLSLLFGSVLSMFLIYLFNRKSHKNKKEFQDMKKVKSFIENDIEKNKKDDLPEDEVFFYNEEIERMEKLKKINKNGK